MNMMEQIKIKIEDSKVVAVDFSVEEVQYLLSKLDAAEKSLEEAKEKTALAVNKMCGGSVKQHVFEDTRAAYYAIDKALQKIRS